jgi:hypothetical protein
MREASIDSGRLGVKPPHRPALEANHPIASDRDQARSRVRGMPFDEARRTEDGDAGADEVERAEAANPLREHAQGAQELGDPRRGSSRKRTASVGPGLIGSPSGIDPSRMRRGVQGHIFRSIASQSLASMKRGTG